MATFIPRSGRVKRLSLYLPMDLYERATELSFNIPEFFRMSLYQAVVEEDTNESNSTSNNGTKRGNKEPTHGKSASKANARHEKDLRRDLASGIDCDLAELSIEELASLKERDS
jgi:hypothetical protein